MSQNDSLLGIHMSDNTLRTDEDLLLDVLDLFGLNEKCLKPADQTGFKLNRPVANTQKIRDIIKIHTGAVSTKEVVDDKKHIDVDSYQKHLFQS